jgi:Protein of unknown function (DUF3987)
MAGLEVKEEQTKKPSSPAPEPMDLWGYHKPPAFPLGLLPDVIERYALTMGGLMGADPASLAMGALVICGAMIPDSIKLKVKRNSEDWDEQARLWVALVGGPASMKSPMLRAVSKPLRFRKRNLAALRGRDTALRGNVP